MHEKPLNEDINYLQGQIHGLRALVLALADTLMDKETFRQEGKRKLETQRTALLSAAVVETTLDGIDEVVAWLSNVTD